MEAMNIYIGPLAFDHADYDPEGDVLYLHIGEPQPGEGEETPEGHILRFARRSKPPKHPRRSPAARATQVRR